MIVIKIVGLVNGEPHEFDGKFVQEYDPGPRLDTEGEFVHLVVTEKIEEARQFKDIWEAADYYLQASKVGLRDDGCPNRPLTVFNVEIG